MNTVFKKYIEFLPLRTTKKLLLIGFFSLSLGISYSFSQISQVGINSTYTTSATSITITKPAGVAVGDIMFINMAYGSSTNGDPTTMGGWTKIYAGSLGSAAYRGAVFYKIVTNADIAATNYTISIASGTFTYVQAGIIAFSGVDLTNPFDVAAPSTITTTTALSTTLNNITAITTNTNNAIVVMLGMNYRTSGTTPRTFSSYTTTSPGTLTEAFDYATGSYVSVGCAFATKATAGPTGTGSMTMSGNGNWIGAVLLALKPADVTIGGNDSWIGYVYDGSNYNFTTDTYKGYYTEPETFYQKFGGDNVNFPIPSNGSTINTETFSVRYRMNSSKQGLYVASISSDDGARLSVDGTTVYTYWNNHAETKHSNVLMNLTGTSSLTLDYYENTQINVIGFQDFNLILENQLTTNTEQTITIGSSGSAISGDAFGALPAGLSNSSYQWYYSTTPEGTKTAISGATGATFTPNTSSAPFNTAGTYYLFRYASVTSSNNKDYANTPPNFTSYTATNVSNYATISISSNPLTSSVFWYKADIGVNGTSTVTSWVDQSGKSNNATNTGTVSLIDNSINFNPYLLFTNVNRQFVTQNSTQPLRFFVVTLPTSTTDLAGLIGAGPGSVTDKGIRLSNDPNDSYIDQSWIGDNNGDDWSSGGASRINAVSSFVHNFKWHIVNQSRGTALGSSQYYIGGYFSGRSYTGQIAEVIAYNSKTDPTDIAIESYLAIKYGITLGSTSAPINYLNTAGATIWDGVSTSTYHNDVAGLGRNDVMKLNQKVSSSINVSSGSARVVMATTNDFTSSNLSASRVALANGQYLIWGHNNGTVNTWTAISTNYSRVNRIWKVQNTGNVGQVNFQIDLTSFASLPSTDYCYVLIVGNSTFSTINSVYPLANTSGNLYTAQPIFPSGTYYFTIARVQNYWMGTTSSSDWGTASNWTANFVPASGQNVTFATTSNFGTVAQNDLQLDQDRVIGNMVNNTTKKLIIPTSKSLTVQGTVTPATDPNLILIKAAVSQPNGSLIFTQPAANTAVNATVEMYAIGYNGAEQIQYDPDNVPYKVTYRWQYFGIPVKTVTASPTHDGSWVREYNETINLGKYYQKWTQLQNSSPMTPFTGYEITQNISQGSSKLITYQGTLVTGDKILNLTYTGDASFYGRGYNIFGNSYTAAIDISKMTFGSGVEQTVYIYNTGSLKDWGDQKTNTTGGAPGRYLAIPQQTSPVIGNEIPSMQGFLLITSNAATVTIPYNATANALIKNTTPQRVGKIDISENETNATDAFSYLKMEVKNDSTYDTAWIFDAENTSHLFDNGWDGYRLNGMQGTSLFSDEETGELQVNTLDNIDEVYLKFMAEKEDTYTLTIQAENILDKYNDLYLKDLSTGTSVKLENKVTTYHFTAKNTESAERRFLIGGIKKDMSKINPFKIIDTLGKLTIKNTGTENGTLYLYDAIGRTILTHKLDAQTTINITDIQKGVYIVNCFTEKNEKYGQKAIIR